MNKFNASLQILGGKYYKIFMQDINLLNSNHFEEEDCFGLLIEKQKRKFIPKYGIVDGFSGVFLTQKNINTGEKALFLIKDYSKKEIYQLENEYTAINNSGMINILKDYNHNSYILKRVADSIPSFIENYFIEKEVEELEEAELLEKEELK